MHLSPADLGLRNALEQITRNYSGQNVRGQVGEVERLKTRFPHSIKVLQVVEDARPGPGQFSCFMQALELSSPPPSVATIMERFDSIYPGAEFIKLLIGRQFLEVTPEPEEDGVLLYFAQGAPKHAGKVRTDMVVSKWGLGHVWQHRAFEVPQSYGDSVRSFRRVDASVAAQWFLDYATGLVGASIIAALIRQDAY